MTPRLTQEESRALAKHIVEELIVRLGRDEDVATIATAWGKYIDQWLGRNLRRCLMFILLVVAGMAAVKWQVWTVVLGK